MRFTAQQYDKAIESLQEAKFQLEPDGRNCSCCGDSGHQAFECGHNPLVAMSICSELSTEARAFHDKLHKEHPKKAVLGGFYHDLLHYLGGFESRMGEVIGPARVVLPKGEPDVSTPSAPV